MARGQNYIKGKKLKKVPLNPAMRLCSKSSSTVPSWGTRISCILFQSRKTELLRKTIKTSLRQPPLIPLTWFSIPASRDC